MKGKRFAHATPYPSYGVLLDSELQPNVRMNMSTQSPLIRPLTKDEIETFPTEVIVKMPEPFKDERGAIQPLVDENMSSAVLISSKKGSVRANHWHETDWHYCYVIEGKIKYSHRTKGSTEPPKVTIINKGELFFTPPLVEHAMEFEEDTIFLTLGRNSRLQEVYEADVKRVKLV